MKNVLLFIFLLICAGRSLRAQTAQRVIGNPTLPTTCQAGPNPQVYVDTNATATAQFYICTSTNVWTLQGSSGGGTWGSITGTLSNQTDLQDALNLKANLITIGTTSPLAGGGDISTNRTLSIANAAADGTTKGAASFTAADFNASSGNISIDYTNGQAASAVAKGFLTSTDWTTFNNKGSGSVTSIATTSPITGGTITSTGTIACATCVTSAASLTSTAIMTGAGSQGSQTPAATATMDTSGNISTPGTMTTGAGGGVAGNVGLGQGTATSVAANTIQFQAPTSVTGYNFVFPSAAGSGILQWTNSANVMTGTLSALTSGRVPVATTNGLLTDDSDLTFSGSTTTMTNAAVTTSLTVAGAAVTNNVVQNSQSADYTAVLGDAGKSILHPSTDTNARTFTIPANASVAYPVGTCITFINMTANVVTIAITSDTMYLAGTGTTGSRSLAQYGVATAYKIDATHWIISGTNLT